MSSIAGDGLLKMVLTLSLAITVNGCSNTEPSRSTEISCQSLECQKVEALLGKKDASAWVLQNVPMSEHHYWAGISAQNGVPSSMYTYALLLSSNSVREECLRALYWARKAENSGVEKAIALRVMLEKQDGSSGFSCGCAPYDFEELLEPMKCKVPASVDLSRYDPNNRVFPAKK
jgi:hypothetical protein